MDLVAAPRARTWHLASPWGICITGLQPHLVSALSVYMPGLLTWFPCSISVVVWTPKLSWWQTRHPCLDLTSPSFTGWEPFAPCLLQPQTIAPVPCCSNLLLPLSVSLVIRGKSEVSSSPFLFHGLHVINPKWSWLQGPQVRPCFPCSYFQGPIQFTSSVASLSTKCLQGLQESTRSFQGGWDLAHQKVMGDLNINLSEWKTRMKLFIIAFNFASEFTSNDSWISDS